MTQIKISSFLGALPRIEPRLLNDNQSQYAKNVRFKSGSILPIKDTSLVFTLPDDQRISIYNYDWASVDNWLSWTTDVDVVKGPIAEDQYNRIYYTGDGNLKMKYTLAGVEQAAVISGIPYPVLTPNVASQEKSTTTWTRTWGYWYEEPDGTKSDENWTTLTEGTVAGANVVVETVVGSEYTIRDADLPAKVVASASAKFVLAFQAVSSTGAILGRLYPNISKYGSSSDLYISGAKVAGSQTTTGDRVLSLVYDTTEVSDYVSDRNYVYTFVSELGEEGPPSEASAMIGVEPNEDVLVSNMDVIQPAGSYVPIVSKRIYRTVTSNAGTEYQFVAEITLTQATYVDNLTDGDVGESIPSKNWDLPVDGLTGIVALPGEFFAAFKGKTVYFSEPQFPHAWPTEYGITCDSEIVGLAVSDNTLVVLTEENPELITAVDPLNTARSKLASVQACLSKRSIEESGGAVIYSSPDGVCAIVGTVVNILTEGMFRKEQWEEYVPSTVQITTYDDLIYVFSEIGAFNFKAGSLERGIVSFDDIVQGSLYTPKDDSLYIIEGDEIRKWAGSDVNREGTWKSKEYASPRPFEWSVGRVTSDLYPLTLNIYANNILVNSHTMVSDKARRLSKMRREKFWAAEVVTSGEVQEILLSTSMSEL